MKNHKKDCQCCICRAIRGETSGRNNPFYGKKHTISTKKEISKTHKGKNNYSYIDGRTLINNHCLDCGKKIKYNSKRCYKCANTKKLNPQYGKHQTDKTKNKISKASIKNWTNPVYRDKVIKLSNLGMHLRPNTPEKILHKLLPKSFKYVGNKNFRIDRYNPDFVDLKQKKIIELFGDYWHNLDSYKERDKRKLKIYKEYGYKTLIIWQRELKNINKVINKIKRFINA